MKPTILALVIMLGICFGVEDSNAKAQVKSKTDRRPAAAGDSDITIRTEAGGFSRGTNSGATYFIYERNGSTICTKIQTCNKYDECENEYFSGAYRDELDKDVNESSIISTPAEPIKTSKLTRHRCLVKFKLIP